MNGSGKSNILKSILTLGEGDNAPTDDDFHAADGEVSDDEIAIEATFSFDKKDAPLIEKFGLRPFELTGFVARVSKKRREKSTIHFTPLGTIDNRQQVLSTRLKQLRTRAQKLQFGPSDATRRDELLARVRRAAEGPADDVEQELNVIERIAGGVQFEDAAAGETFLSLVAEVRKTIHQDLNSAIVEVFSALSIELLQLNAYSLESNAPIAELAARDEHPFLYDLLQLAKTRADAFDHLGSPALARTKDAASRNLSKAIAGVWLSHNLKFQIDRHEDNLIFMVFTPQDRQISLTDLSDGEQWFLKFYVRLAIAQREGRQVLWLFDEPGRDLHTSSQIDLKAFFERIALDAQIVYTSHLSMMIPWHRLERIFVVENSVKDGTIVHNRFWKDTDTASPLNRALSTFIGEELIGGKEHLIVEGISDVFYLQAWIRYFQNQTPVPNWVKSYALLRRVLVPVDGVEKIPLYCWFLGRKIKKRVNWVAVVDSADESRDATKKITEAGLGMWTKNVRSIAELIASRRTASDKLLIQEIEAAFHPGDYAAMFRAHYQERYPECELPSEHEVLERFTAQVKAGSGLKLTKVIEELLRK